MDKITATQFGNLKDGLVTTSFEMLDVNGDNVIDEKDLKATNNSQIKNDIQTLLDMPDEEPTIDGDLNLENINNENKGKTEATVTPTTDETNKPNSTTQNSSVQMPTGYENVDVSDSALSGKTTTELQALLAKINNNIKLINERINTLDKEYDQLNKEIAELQKENTTLESQMAEPAAKKRAEEEKLPAAQQQVADESEKLQNYTDEYEGLCEQLEKINNRIRAEQHFEEMRYERSMAEIANDAINSYDPATDGEDFEAYYLSKMNSVGYVAFSGLTRLNRQAEIYATDAGKKLQQVIDQSKVVYAAKANLSVIQANIKKYADQMGPIQTKIDANNAIIRQKQSLQATNRSEYNALTAQKTVEEGKKTTILTKLNGGGLSAKDLLALIPQAEKDLAKNNNVDLTKCIIAQGKNDGIWHIYLNNGTSLARKYGKKGGFDIIAKGNGYIRHQKESDTGSAIYTLSEVNEDMTDGTATCKYYTYETYSPLSFDVDGDGFNTNDDIVIFDIDGDGELDRINNSSEWVLAFDKDHNGKAGENGSELFGDNTDLDGDGKADGYENGFEALKALAEKEGLIGKDDRMLDEDDIELLTKKYGLTMTNGYGGEAKTLSELGITQINLAQTDETYLSKNFDGNQNDIMRQDGATFIVNGETREYADIWHSKKEDQSQTPQQENSQRLRATTNDADITLELNERGIVALKGKVDYTKIKNHFKYNLNLINKGQDISDAYKAKQEENALQAKKDAIAAENKKAEEMKAEEKKKEQKKNPKQ